MTPAKPKTRIVTVRVGKNKTVHVARDDGSPEDHPACRQRRPSTRVYPAGDGTADSVTCETCKRRYVHKAIRKARRAAFANKKGPSAAPKAQQAPESAPEPVRAPEMTIGRLRAVLDQMEQASPLGADTCVYACLPNTVYTPIGAIMLDQDPDGAVLLFAIAPSDSDA